MRFIKENYRLLTLAVMAVSFFFIYSYLSFSTPQTPHVAEYRGDMPVKEYAEQDASFDAQKWERQGGFSIEKKLDTSSISSRGFIFNSPDETANFYFSKIFAEEGRMWQTEPLEFVAGNSIFPRSIKAIGGRLVPVGFLGLPFVYGIIAKIFGIGIIKFLTPLFACLAVLAFYGIIHRVFGEKTAFFSSILMFALPPFMYYAERGMFHNVLFLSFLIFSVYFTVSAGKRFVFWALGGLFLALALMTRLSEIWWIAPVFIASVLIFRKSINWRGLFIAATMSVLVFIPFLAQNKILYGSPFATGYQSQIDEGQTPVSAVQNYLSEKKDSELVFPFGINPKNILRSGWNYFIIFFPWLTLPALAGIIWFLAGWKNKSKKEKYYFCVFCFVATWLFIYYGSWQLNDNLDPNKITIGTSYLRYWLPVFVMILPFFAEFFAKIAGKTRFYKIGAPITVLFFILSFRSVFFAGGEGIVAVKNTLLGYEARAKEVFEITEPNSVIVTDRNDKLFFPERKIIYPLRSENTFRAASSLLEFVPVYYYGLEISGEEKFGGLKLESVKKWGNEGLYEFKISDF